METVRTKTSASARTRSVAFVGLAIAIIAVSAWVTVPLGPIPFTLQMFAVTFAVVVLSPKEAIASIAGYLLLGAVGVPVFSGMRGGIGVLAGPTGGFLWGYLFGVAAAALFLYVVRTKLGVAGGKGAPKLTRAEVAALSPGRRAVLFVRNFGVDIVAGIIFTAIAYACGCIQYMAVGQVDLATAFLTAVAPFMVVDFCKIVAAVVCADAVRAVVK
ncbi:biotin transporter BioY [Adlercreutzia caecimuris]|uniref:biotin transporter BioY n=1 Tax=Adlercreutzia caecimuris TaxID=671266 RepID=UPI001C3CA00A|nr:biotin transporter BioY [Adlercreutzia caecimuris]MCR2037296.1 biotin transporter BioY [Adlercreutzia caecimuris]